MFKPSRDFNIPWRFILLFLSFVVFLIYYITSAGRTPYDYFTRLATSFLQGKYYLTENPAWLNELVKIGENKFAVVYPPTPAIISLPFVFLFRNGIQQQIICQIMGALATFIMGEIAFLKSKNKAVSFWIFLLSAFGNIIWYLTSNGSSWYFGQVCAFLFLALTIYESTNKKRVPFIAIYFGLAILSRLQVALAFPLILYLNRFIFKNTKKLLSLILGLSFFVIMYGTYNYLRFGSFMQTGYTLIPNVMNEPWYKNGLFNLSNIPSHLKIIFASFPTFTKNLPYIKPSWGGLAIWITSPIFVYSLFNNFKNKLVWFSWISIILITLVIFSHGTTGFTQFGYRFAVDFYPILIFLIIESVTRTGLKWHHWLLLAISIIVNTWGVILINKFGWVGW